MQGILVKMALRNLMVNRRRSIITMLGIAFGVMMAVLFTGLQDATWRATINSAAELGSGHVTIQHRKYLDEPSISNSIVISPALIRDLQSNPQVNYIQEKVVTHAMIATAANSAGAMVYGIDMANHNAPKIKLLEGNLTGKPLQTSDKHGIIIGAELATRLEVRRGQKVVYTFTNNNNDIVSFLGRVNGILETGSPSLDSIVCLVPMNMLRKQLGYNAREVTQLSVLLHDHRDSIRVAETLKNTLPSHTPLTALPWQRINPDLDGLVATKMASADIFEILILILVAAGIFNTLYVSVMERMREFGIMNAIGFSERHLFGLIVWESAFTAVGGLLLSLLLTAGPYYYMYHTGIDLAEVAAGGKEMTVNGAIMTTVIHVDIYAEKLAMIILTTIIATLLAGIYPAARAGKVAPVESIRLV